MNHIRNVLLILISLFVAGCLLTGCTTPATPASTNVPPTTIFKKSSSAPFTKKLPATIEQGSLVEETEHYTIYYPEGEQISASYVGGVLEDHLEKVSQDLGYQPQEKIKVIIFSDLDTFHQAIELPNAPEWVIVAGYEGGIQMVTPRLISTDMLEPAIIHELTHAIQGQINPDAPFWMIEGIAMYEAGMSQGVRETIGKRVQKADLPALDSLETLDEEDFAQADGYALGYTVVEYAVQAYGHAILAEWVKTPRDYKRVFGVPKERFEEQWMSWLAETYRS